LQAGGRRFETGWLHFGKSLEIGRVLGDWWYSVLAESTAGEYHIGPHFAGDWGGDGLQAGGHWFEPGSMEPTEVIADHPTIAATPLWAMQR
jgi:hypothetical protein